MFYEFRLTAIDNPLEFLGNDIRSNRPHTLPADRTAFTVAGAAWGYPFDRQTFETVGAGSRRFVFAP